MKRTLSLALFASALIAISAGPVWGHAEQVTSDPAAGAKVADPINHMVINLTETPVKDGTTVAVSDGCGIELASEVIAEEKTIRVRIEQAGAPGPWKVRYTTVSAEDGHASEGKIGFAVKGKADCSGESADQPPVTQPGDDEDAVAKPPDDDEGSFPALPVAAAVTAILGIALLARGASGRSGTDQA